MQKVALTQCDFNMQYFCTKIVLFLISLLSFKYSHEVKRAVAETGVDYGSDLAFERKTSTIETLT